VQLVLYVDEFPINILKCLVEKFRITYNKINYNMKIDVQVFLIISFCIINLNIVLCISTNSETLTTSDYNHKVESTSIVGSCKTGSCNSPNLCFADLDESALVCNLEDGTKGVCCLPNTGISSAKNDGIVLKRYFQSLYS